ncbi:MAG: TIGR03085 family metal-binding protein [Acidimicrobiales bacterium]
MTPSGPGESVAQRERLALCALLEDKGPLAPTLCDGWTTADLAAHVFVRESRPWAGAGILVPALAGITERSMDEAKRSLGYKGLLARVRSGPPSLLKPFDAQVNTVEFFVHHEDVRRAGAEEATPGSRDDAVLDAALWNSLKRGARLLARKLNGPGLELVAPGHGSVMARHGSPLVTMTASPQELVLYLFGRKSVAKVELDGPPEALQDIEGASFGI